MINSDFDASWFQTIEALTCKNNFYVTQTAHSYNEKITAEEIHKAIRCSNGSNKSMDTDGVHPLMLKHCGHQFQMILFFLVNSAFSTGKWPWQKGNVTLIKKPGKERKAGYSTGSYMLELISVIENNVKIHTFTAGIFVDLQKALDSVWLSSLVSCI